jgi:hypothetical protein
MQRQSCLHGTITWAPKLFGLPRLALGAARQARRRLAGMADPIHMDCPQQLTERGAAEFLMALFRHSGRQHLSINFNTLEFARPIGALTTAMGLRALQHAQAKAGFQLQAARLDPTRPAVSYLMHMGFFRCIGIPAGNDSGVALGNTRYVPLSLLQHSSLPGAGVLQERIVDYSQRLAAVLTTGRPGIGKSGLLAYSLREAIRNVFEHSGRTECWIAAQRWAGGETEIAIADEGVGLMYTLSRAYSVPTPEDALRLAIRPGISGNTEPDTGSMWQNSGYGLYVLSELGARLGSFVIGSDRAVLLLERHGASITATPLGGTIVGLRVNSALAGDFPSLLKDIVSRGEAASTPGARRSASAGTQTV